MLKQSLNFKLLQKLSPQQIQLMKLIQLPTQAFEERLKQEIEENPALDTGKEEPDNFDDLANEYDDAGTEKIDAEDINNDGYTDAYLMRQGANQLWLQDSVGQFTHSLFEGIEGDGSNTLNGAFIDADHDGDLDLLLVNKQGNVSLLNNNLNGSFSNISENLPEKVNSLNIIIKYI